MPILGLPATMALLVALAAAVPSRPPSPAEQKAFAEGLRLYQAGDARGAERVWTEGYAAGHDPAFLVRIGEAEERAGAPHEAAQTYQRYLRESPNASDRADIEARLGRLIPPGERKPPTTATAGGTTDDEGSGDDTPGTQTPGTQTPGTQTPETMSGVAPGARGNSSAAPASGPSAASARAAETATLPATAAAPQARDEAGSDDDGPRPLFGENAYRTGLNVTAWVGVGVTALLLGTAAFFGASAADKATDLNRLLTYRDDDTKLPQEYAARADQYEEDLRVGRRDDRAAKGLLITAGATAVASAVLFIIDGAKAANTNDRADAVGPAGGWSARRRTSVVARSGSTGPQCGLSWSF